MRYRLETTFKDGVEIPKKIKENNKVYYTVKSDSGVISIVPKKWVVKNKRFISNISFGGSSIYVIKDEYDKAIELIIERMIQKMTSYPEGLDLFASHYMAVINQSIDEVTKFRKTLNDVDVWNFLRGYEVDTQKVYIDCLRQAINKCDKEVVLLIYADEENSRSELFANSEALKSRIKEKAVCRIVKDNLMKEICECIFYEDN